MKLLLTITYLLGYLFIANCQPANKYYQWEHPILKALEKKQPSLVPFGRDTDDDYFIPLAILDKTHEKLYYVSTFGFLFDSIPVGPVLLKQLMAKRTDAFSIYTSLVTKECLEELETVKEQVRENKFDLKKMTSQPTCFVYTPLENAISPLERLTFLANLEMLVWQNYQLMNMVLADKADVVFLQKKANWVTFKPAKVKLHGNKELDSVVFTASNRFSRLGHAVLHPATGIIYLYNRTPMLVDSFIIKKNIQRELTSDKEDVFALYRLWLEWQLEITAKNVNSLTATKGAKYSKEPFSRDQYQKLDTLLQYASFLESKIRYATLPDKDLLLINFLQDSKTATHRKKWNRKTGQWEIVPPEPPLPIDGTMATFNRGQTEYFLADHRGNVMATVSDRKIPVDANNDGIVDYYKPDVITATDYAPFGSLLSGRQYRANGKELKYGYNGKENDNEVKGEGNQQDYGFRIYDTRLGKFLSVDPFTKSFPWNSPYSYAEGDVIRSIDLEGLEKYVVTHWYDNKGNHRKTTIKAIRTQDTKKVIDMNFSTANGGDLTDKDVWVRKLYLDGRQKEAATGKAELNASEKALFGKAVTKKESEPNEYPTINYDLGDENGDEGTKSKEFDSEQYEYRMATKNVPLIKDKDLKLVLQNGTFFNGNNNGITGLTSRSDASQIFKQVPDLKKFHDLPALIKEDGTIKSINIVVNVHLPATTSDATLNNYKASLESIIKPQLKEKYGKSGVKNITIQTNVDRSSDPIEAYKQTPPLTITLNR